jgi:HK97 family phage portal protein
VAFWNSRETRAAPTATMDNPPVWLLDSLGASPVDSGKRVTVTNAMGLIPVYSAVSMIAECVGTLPFKVYRQVDDGVREEARGHHAWRLLNQKPNSSTPAGRFWSTVTAHLLLYGNAFIEKVGRGPNMELLLWPPDEVEVKWWPHLGEKTFIRRPREMGARTVELDESDILHITNLSLDGIVGMSVIEHCRNPLGSALARDEFEGRFYRQGTVLSGVVQMKGSVKNPEALSRFKESLKALFSGSPRSHGVPVFEDGAEWKPTSSPLRDLQFVESQNLTATQVATLFKLPPNYLGGSSGDGLVYATVEMNQTHFALHAVAPIVNTIAEAVSQDPAILPQNVFEAEFVLEGMLKADAESRANFYEKLIGMKAMLPEEVRKLENMPPFTPAQKREANPPPPAPPQQLQLPEDPADPAPVNGNGNGNGAMPAIQRS